MEEQICHGVLSLSLSLALLLCVSLTFFLEIFGDEYLHTFSSFVSVSDSEQLSRFTVVATPNDALGKTTDDGVLGLIRSNLSSLSLRNVKST